jgi:centromere protein I
MTFLVSSGISRRVSISPHSSSQLQKERSKIKSRDNLLTIQAASKVPAKRRQTGIKSTVESTTSLLYDRGALPDELARLVDLLTVRNHLDQASLGVIVRNLYPSGKIGDEVVLRFVGALGHGQLKPSLPLQALFLRWLVMVHHLLENPTILSQVYGLLFNLLDTAAIRSG